LVVRAIAFRQSIAGAYGKSCASHAQPHGTGTIVALSHDFCHNEACSMKEQASLKGCQPYHAHAMPCSQGMAPKPETSRHPEKQRHEGGRPPNGASCFCGFFVAIYCSVYVIAVAHNSRNGYHTGCCERVIQDEIDSDGQRPE
jgi:hypothetical protein